MAIHRAGNDLHRCAGCKEQPSSQEEELSPAQVHFKVIAAAMAAAATAAAMAAAAKSSSSNKGGSTILTTQTLSK